LQLLWSAKSENKKLPLVTRHVVAQLLSPDKKNNSIRPDMFSGLSVLVVEDMKVNRTLITKILEKHGCEVHCVTNGKEALETMTTAVFDLVLMDCQMPEMDGFEATKLYRQFEKNHSGHRIIVALTADALTGDREKCLAAGMDDYLNKPFRPEEITALLTRWIKSA